jgi:hypothetical protein
VLAPYTASANVHPVIQLHRTQMNQLTRCSNFLGLLLCRLIRAQHVSGILMLIIRSSKTAVAASGLPLERGGSSAVGRGRAGRCCEFRVCRLGFPSSCRPARPRPTTLLPPRSNVKPEAGTVVVELLMMGVRMPETCLAVVCFLLGNSQASEFYMPTFRNTLSVPSS